MIINTSNKAAYICAACGNGVRNVINIFSLSDNKEHIIKCPVCGSEAFRIKKSKKHSVNISTECLYCGNTHHKNISAREFQSGNFGSIYCPVSNMGALFYGSSDKQLADALTSVFEAMEELANEYKQALHTVKAPEEYSLEKEMLNAFNTLNREQNISCSCGNTEIAVSVSEDNKILLKCSCCGKSKKYDISKDNLLRLINTSFVVLVD